MYEDSKTLSEWGFDLGKRFEVWHLTYNDIVKHQDAFGYWTIDVLKVINKNLEDVLANISELISSKFSDTNELLNIICTVLALQTLQSKYANNADEWKLIFKKGERYLQSQGFNYCQLVLSI